MLDKYKKLAHDAHLNGDRVQEEYYLQFADHYFRVLADQKQRQEDARQRRDERGPENGDSGRSDEPRYRDDYEDGEDGEEVAVAAPVSDRNRPVERDEEESNRSGDDAVYEPAQNPFVRDNAATRGAAAAKPPRKPRRPAREAAPAADEGDTPELNLGVDPAVLPPSIGAEKVADEPEAATEPEVKPRRRTTRKKVAADKPVDDSGEKLEAVS